MLTYNQQMKLVEQGLAKISKDEENNLCTFKYAKKVMFDYLWDKHPELLECRGHVYDLETKELVVAAPTKTFNYLENGTWKDMQLDTEVYLYKKLNGFLGNATMHKGKLIVSTTGTTTSDYAKLARKLIEQKDSILCKNNWCNLPSNITWSYEICDSSDPHIVQEDQGAHYIGHRFSNELAVEIGTHFYPTGQFIDCTLQEALELVKTDEGEGYMVYTNYNHCCKLKTPYYVGKKKLMRMNKQQVSKMYNPEQRQNIIDNLPERWKYAVKYITWHNTQEEWSNKTDQERRTFLEALEKGCTK